MKIFGTIIVVAVVLALALFLTPWILMMVVGALAANSSHINTTIGFWESFFGLWALGILGTTWNVVSFWKSNDNS